MAQLDPVGILRSQQQTAPSPTHEPSLSLDAHDLQQSAATQGKEARTHDFLSICGTGASSTSTVMVTNTAPQQSAMAQDFLQTPQTNFKPGVLPQGFVLTATKPHISSNDFYAGQQNAYAYSNGSLDLSASFQSKYRSTTISFGAKGHVPHAIPLNKHWQQQQAGLDALDGNKRLPKLPSEEDDDEDDESYEHGYSTRKDTCYPKSDTVQQGRYSDSKGATPRSKHSATEQRRRSKINDRFQMLRQLLPNADQKRDKASFLLEVIEHIQMLHEKVKKYEAAEHKGQQQDRAKILSWDRSSGHQDVITTHDSKEVPVVTPFVRNRLSPLRMTTDDGITSSELTCGIMQASTLHGAPGCLSNGESKLLVSKPIPLSFSQASATPILEQISNPIYLPEGQKIFSQLHRHDEQAAIKGRSPFSHKVEIIASPHLQQSRNMSIPQELNQGTDQALRKSRSSEQNFNRLEEEAEEQMKSSLVTDIGSTSKDSGKHACRPTYGCDGKGPVYGMDYGNKVEQRGEVPTNQQGTTAVLGGVINISSVYSQGLLDTLTQALRSSGVDMAQATISVQIDLGKPGGSVLPSSKKVTSLNAGAVAHQNKETVSSQESEHPKKRPKIEDD